MLHAQNNVVNDDKFKNYVQFQLENYLVLHCFSEKVQQ